MKKIKQFENFDAELIHKQASFIKSEERTIEQISDLLEQAYFRGLADGLKKGGLSGEFTFGNLQMDISGYPEMSSIEDVNDYIDNLSEKAKQLIMKLNDLK